MSDSIQHKRRDRFLKPFNRFRSRSRTPSPAAPPATPVRDELPGSSTSKTDPAFSAPSLQPPAAAAASKPISLDDVMELLDSKHRSTLLEHRADPLDIGTTIQNAISAAEEKQKQCDERKWRLTIGNKTVILRDKVDTVIGLISKFKDIGSIATGADPVHAGLPWAGICLLLQTFTAQKEQMDALMNGILVALSMQQTVDLYLEIYNDQPAGAHADDLRRSLLKVYAAVLAFLAEALRLLGANGPTHFCNALLGDDSLRKFPSNCREHLEDVAGAARLCDRQLDKRTAELVADTRRIIADITDQLEVLQAEAVRTRTKIDFQKLPTATDAQHDSYQPDLTSCLKGTRVDLIDEICRWADDPSGECFYWLQGKAGEGKSTIAKTLAEALQDQDMLGASFFFKRSHADRGSARFFFPTIAAQLAQKIDGLGSAIAKVLDVETSRYDKSVQIQFEDLIAAPLRGSSEPLRSTHGGLVIVVDALDECFDDDIKQLVNLLARAGSFGIRTFITSRPDEPAVSTLRCLKGAQCREAVLGTHTQAAIHHDISLFLTEKLEDLRSDKPALAADWPGRDRVEELTRRSVPLFIFAATVCRFLLTPGSTPEELLDTVLKEPSRLPLTMTYRPILERWLAVRTPLQGREAAIAEFRNIVGPVLFSAEPLPVSLVAIMSGLANDKLEARLDLLRSVLQTSKHDGKEHYTIKTFHLSFQDFIVRSEESLGFKIEEQQTHNSMADVCLWLMMQPGKLRQDICAVGKPGIRRLDVDPHLIDTHINPDLSYACRYWLYHQVRSGQVLDDSHQIYKFLARHFLYWFEAMAWLGKTYEILPVLRQLKPLIDVRQADTRSSEATRAGSPQYTCSAKLHELVEDVQYFIRDFSYIADQAPPQLYASALAFAPMSSLVKSLFGHCMPRWLILPPRVADVWEANSLVLEGHTGFLGRMSFSSCGEYLATCAILDGMLRVWHSATGNCILRIPESENGAPVAVSFSHDNKCLAAAYLGPSLSQTNLELSAIIYDTKTGNVIETYVCIRVENTRRLVNPGRQDHNIRLAFTPGPGEVLLIAILCEDRLEVLRTESGSRTFEQASTLR